MDNQKYKELSVSLYEIGAIKFGQFKLKSGVESPIYFDLRTVISHPKIMKQIGELIWEKMQEKNLEFKTICGVPYTALPMATVVSVDHNIPMVMRRKEVKTYGTGKSIEGEYEPGTRCLIIEDVVTTGSSILETAELLRNHGMVVTDAVVILDRSCGKGFLNLQSQNIKMESLLEVNQILDFLLQQGSITKEQFVKARKFLTPSIDDELDKMITRLTCPISQKLLRIMMKKKTNLCLSADVENWTEVIELAQEIGPYICLLKTHVDLLNFKSFEDIQEFQRLLKKASIDHDFLILEDRKFGDIGSTVQRQLVAKPFEIVQWADMVTVHGISGPGIFQAFQGIKDVGVIVIAEMSSVGNIPTKLAEYKNECYQISQGFENLLVGFVSQSRVGGHDEKNKSFLQFSPGVALQGGGGDGLGQQYCSIEDSILKRGADVIIVGRGILKQSKDTRKQVAQQFQQQGWEAFVKKITK